MGVDHCILGKKMLSISNFNTYQVNCVLGKNVNNFNFNIYQVMNIKDGTNKSKQQRYIMSFPAIEL